MNDSLQSTADTAPCARFETHLGAYLERELEPREMAFMEHHRAHCATCDAMVRDLDGIVASAAQLPGFAPSRDLWSGISDRIATPVTSLPLRPEISHAARAPRSMSIRRFAVAATLLVAVSSAVTWRVASTRRAPIAATVADGPSSAVVPVMTSTVANTNVASANVVYEDQILALRTIVDQRFRELDTTTVAELRRNLAIIDRAIADSKAALAKDPNSQVVAGSLDRALANKLALMRRVALL